MTSNIHSHHIGQSGHEQCIYCNAKWGSGLRVRVMNDLNNFTTWCEYCKHQTSINMILHLHLREPKSTIISCVALSSVCSVCYVVSDIYCWCWYFCHGTTALTALHCTAHSVALHWQHLMKSERLCCGHLPNSCGGVAKAACRLPLRGSQWKLVGIRKHSFSQSQFI